MVATNILQPSILDQLSAAIVNNMKRPAAVTPMVFEQGDCVVVEMKAPRLNAEEIDLRLEGDYTLVISSPNRKLYARVALPSRISLADSVVYVLGGILSMTFLKADAISELEADADPAYDLALAAV